ncbi:YggS family pyridoxal phosphate-dependent enzyme [Paenibacillus hexagrammi]|uniref:Pyridoxal phosphate homeostasis protein n=1 Tax=Paenibacillus hexagrammi TaxID=2908839 RepID=A0ABY3SMQ8_9BACL|nr:YggS family pyridoxal phosphate-dependent enzyme [Paenibacillus sp. YPD9-1]UJF35147.1 YggS family pyridoxal phosphate-dependent enzyme [Paenibacillus sp. YPD9-1]
MALRDQILEVQTRIQAACERSGRSRQDVELIAVTKYVSLETTRAVLDEGILHIGENRWQDVKPKWEALHDRGTWHFIGHLQTNKVKDVIGKFDYIHSLDRLSLAKELDKQAAAKGLQLKCLLQVNVSGEESKYGMAPEELFDFGSEISAQMKHIHIKGLMTMAPYDVDAEAARPYFRKLRELRDLLNGRDIFPYEVKHLSMGMSGDFEVAIEEGATMIRLGSVLVKEDSHT